MTSARKYWEKSRLISINFLTRGLIIFLAVIFIPSTESYLCHICGMRMSKMFTAQYYCLRICHYASEGCQKPQIFYLCRCSFSAPECFAENPNLSLIWLPPGINYSQVLFVKFRIRSFVIFLLEVEYLEFETFRTIQE